MLGDIITQMSNYDIIQEQGRCPIKHWTRGVEFEQPAIQQLRDIASLPFIHSHVAVMPDVHFGSGATVGSVIPTKHAVIPAAVGVDIGCGMVALQLDVKASQLPDNLKAVRAAIEAAVPHGFSSENRGHHKGTFVDASNTMLRAWKAHLADDYDIIIKKYPSLAKAAVTNQLGTLGGGNHFIELCVDTDDNVWIMLHSGSRGAGNMIGSYFITLAKKEMEKNNIHLPNKNLAYFNEGSQLFDDYWFALNWAQDYAKINRDIMLNSVVEAIQKHIPIFGRARKLRKAINCHHNYVSRENHFGENVFITRKGAVSADLGELGIIPGSMGAKSFIVRGLGNNESFRSCSHGAGRKMSRGAAKKAFTVEDHILATRGVECRRDEDVLDETPGAYKDIDACISAQSDLVEIVTTLKQVVCIKG